MCNRSMECPYKLPLVSPRLCGVWLLIYPCCAHRDFMCDILQSWTVVVKNKAKLKNSMVSLVRICSNQNHLETILEQLVNLTNSVYECTCSLSLDDVYSVWYENTTWRLQYSLVLLTDDCTQNFNYLIVVFTTQCCLFQNEMHIISSPFQVIRIV